MMIMFMGDCSGNMMSMVTMMTLADSQADDDDNSWVGADDDG